MDLVAASLAFVLGIPPVLAAGIVIGMAIERVAVRSERAGMQRQLVVMADLCRVPRGRL